MNTIRRTDKTLRHALLAALGGVALAVCTTGWAQPEGMLVTAQALPEPTVALAAEIDAAVSEARERLKYELRSEIGQNLPANTPLRLSELPGPERG